MRRLSSGLPLALLFMCLLPTAVPAQHGGGGADPRLDSRVGAYRATPHGTMALSRFVHGENTIYLFTDFTDGWRGALHPLSGDTFAVVPHQGPPGTAEPVLVLTSDPSGVPGLELHLRDRPTRVGRFLEVTTEPTVFEVDSVRLAGEMVLPPGPGPHPGIVFVHGSGPATRDDYREWSYFFAANGVATLIYDKRGAGASRGDHRSATFHDLARDALAAVRTMRAHPRVDAGTVGLSGGSQGAWVTPITAGLDGELAFLILTGGGPITPAEQEIYRRARIVRDAGYPDAEVEAARTVVTRYFDYLGSGGKDPALASRVADAWASHGNKPWFSLLDLPSHDPTVGEWPEGRRRFAAELHFDPAPSVRALTTPTLAVLGSEDQGFPTERVADAYRAFAPRDLLTLRSLPGVDHGFWVTDDASRGRHQSPALFEGLLAWIRRQVQSDPR